jgi:hypothetical protein
MAVVNGVEARRAGVQDVDVAAVSGQNFGLHVRGELVEHLIAGCSFGEQTPYDWSKYQKHTEHEKS